MAEVEIEIDGSNLEGETWDAGGYTINITSLADGQHTVSFKDDDEVFTTSFTKSGASNVKADALRSDFAESNTEAEDWEDLGLDPLDDGDRDALPALVEYGLGTDLESPTDGLVWDPVAAVLRLPGSGEAEDLPDDTHLIIERSTSLTDDDWTIVTQRPPDGDWQPDLLNADEVGPHLVPPQLNAPTAFYRLRVELP